MSPMNTILPTLGLLAAVLAACASPAAAGRERGSASADATFSPSTTAPLPADATAPQAAASPAAASGLSIWNDPSFQRRFAESYLAESDVEPRVTAAEREQLQQIMQLIAADEMDAAAERLEAARGDGASAVVDFTLGSIHFQKDRLEPAAAAYEVAVGKYPKFRRARRNLGVIRVRQNEFAKATTALRRVIELGGGDAVTYGLLGFANANLGDPVAAESAYRLAALLDPDTMDWQLGLARSFFEQERYADAAALCKSLISAHPDRTDLWLLQANAWLGLGKPLQAAENFEMVDRLGRSTPDSLNLLGDIYVNEELYDLAVQSYLQAMQLNPQAGPDRGLRAAKVLGARGALAQSQQLVERIQELHGDQLDDVQKKDLLKLRARLAVAAGAAGEEVLMLQQIVALDPLDGEALILLGQHYARAGDVEQAVFQFERAESIDACEADAKLYHAQLLVGKQRYAEALPLLRRVQALKPRDYVQQYLDQVERVAQNR